MIFFSWAVQLHFLLLEVLIQVACIVNDEVPLGSYLLKNDAI